MVSLLGIGRVICVATIGTTVAHCKKQGGEGNRKTWGFLGEIEKGFLERELDRREREMEIQTGKMRK